MSGSADKYVVFRPLPVKLETCRLPVVREGPNCAEPNVDNCPCTSVVNPVDSCPCTERFAEYVNVLPTRRFPRVDIGPWSVIDDSVAFWLTWIELRVLTFPPAYIEPFTSITLPTIVLFTDSVLQKRGAFVTNELCTLRSVASMPIDDTMPEMLVVVAERVEKVRPRME